MYFNVPLCGISAFYSILPDVYVTVYPHSDAKTNHLRTQNYSSKHQITLSMNYKTIILLFALCMTTAINAQKVLVHGINSPTGSVQAIHQYEDGNCHYTPVTDVTISADSIITIIEQWKDLVVGVTTQATKLQGKIVNGKVTNGTWESTVGSKGTWTMEFLSGVNEFVGTWIKTHGPNSFNTAQPLTIKIVSGNAVDQYVNCSAAPQQVTAPATTSGFNVPAPDTTNSVNPTNPLAGLEGFTKAEIVFSNGGVMNMLTSTGKNIVPNANGFVATETTQYGEVIYAFQQAGSGMEVKMTFAVGNQGIKNPVFMGSRNVADSTITLIATDDAGLGMSQLKLTYGTATIVTTAQPVKQQPAADGKMTIQQAFERMTDGKTTGPNNAWTDSPTYSDKVVSGNRLTLTVKGNGGDVAAIYEITEVNGMWEWKEYSQSDPQNHLYKMTSVIPNASAENLEVNFTTGSLTGAKMVVNFGQPAATAPAPVKDGDDGTNNATKRRVPAPAKSGGNR